jgi:hypothetical protein
LNETIVKVKIKIEKLVPDLDLQLPKALQRQKRDDPSHNNDRQESNPGRRGKLLAPAFNLYSGLLSGRIDLDRLPAHALLVVQGGALA